MKIKDKIYKTNREIDFLLVDSAGHVDVLEIKRAFNKNSLLMKTPYRSNRIAARELSGGVGQIEKYIYHLINWGYEGEKALTAWYRSRLPENLEIRFLNPKGLLLMGHCDFTPEEQMDFDIIRRQYAHVADIITYDDLLSRLSRMIAAFS